MVGEARVVEAERRQLSWELVDLDGFLARDHRARVVWGFVSSLDLSAFYEEVGSREGRAGRPAADPRVLLALWLYATLEGVGSARLLARLCEQDLTYRWLRGGVGVDYHTLSDFRRHHVDRLDQLLTESVASLLAAGVASLDEVAVDGTKVRASAGRGSYRKAGRLMAYAEAARQRVAALRAEIDSDSAGPSRRRQGALARCEREYAAKVAAATAKLSALQEEKARREKTHRKQEGEKAKAGKEPKASTTDPEARLMRFADGGCGAGYNVQLAISTESQVILAVQETDRRNDTDMAEPMVEQLGRRYRRRPARLLADTKYASRAAIVGLAGHPTAPIEIYMPPPPDSDKAKAESVRKREWQRKKEHPALKAWRARMESDEGKATYRRRLRIEGVNGNLKMRGFGRLVVRGLRNLRAVALLHALAHNLWRAHQLLATA
jgi:transposase